jgi:anti-sigma factor (TIGR02949 family)
MNRCDEHAVDILLFLDNSLSGNQLKNFQAHLAACPDCASRLAEERALSSALRKTRPLYSAPEALRARVAEIAALESRARSWELDRPRKARSPRFSWSLRDIFQPVLNWKTFAAATLAFVLSLILVPGAVQRARAASYAHTALATHRSYLAGDLPLQVQSDSPEVVTAWFAGKTAFHFQLPVSQPAPNDQPVYRLQGGRVVSYGGHDVAMVAYEMPNEKVTLLVASSEFAAARGGEEVRSEGLTFHYRTGEGFNVITWTNHNLTYALVSSLSGSAQHSCMVCHHQNGENQSATSGQ